VRRGYEPFVYPERPVLKLAPSRVERVADAVAAIGVLVCFAAVAATFVFVDGPIPTHMNARGEVDAWGDSKGVLVVLAMLGAGIPAALTGLRGSPQNYNYGAAVVTAENAPRLYRLGRELVAIMGASVAWTFAKITAEFGMIGAGFHLPTGPGGLILTLALTFVPLGIYIVRIHRAA
jgi:hypothetical protein